MKKKVMCSFPPISPPLSLFHHLHFLLFFSLKKEEEGKTNRKKERKGGGGNYSKKYGGGVKTGEEGRKEGGEKMLSENIKKWYKSFSFFCFCLFLPFVASYTAGLFRDEGAYSLAWRTLDEWSS